MRQSGVVIPLEKIEQRILTVRAQRVMLDSDLADLYGVTTKRLNEQVRRNRGRFPRDFMFRLTKEEAEGLRSQNATSKGGRGGRRYLPSVFTEHGAIMLASVLNTTRAVDVSVYVVRAFVRLREMMGTNREVAAKLGELEQRVASHDEAIRSLVQAIRQLMDLPPPSVAAANWIPRRGSKAALSRVPSLTATLIAVRRRRGVAAARKTDREGGGAALLKFNQSVPYGVSRTSVYLRQA